MLFFVVIVPRCLCLIPALRSCYKNVKVSESFLFYVLFVNQLYVDQNIKLYFIYIPVLFGNLYKNFAFCLKNGNVKRLMWGADIQTRMTGRRERQV